MNLNLTPAETAVLLRNDLSAFIHRCFIQLNPETSYQHNWHIDLIAAKLDACLRGEIRRLVINVPPRSLKSICASIAFPAWVLGHMPSAQVLCASYGQDLSVKLALDCRSVMTSDWYRHVFETRLMSSRPSASDFSTTKQGGRLATSVGGVLTGRGADFIIIDDPLKPDEALSDVQRQAVNGWFDHTVLSRLNDKKTGCVIMIMQRLHLDDLVGHVLEQEGWEVLSLPAIAEQEESFTFDTLFDTRTVVRQIGDVLHPEREPFEVLQQIRATLGEYNFAGQYQQSPAPRGGGMVKEEWLVYAASHEWPQRFEQIVQSWDTASKETELSDFSVCTTWGIYEKKRYLIDVFRKRMAFPELKRSIIELENLYKPNVILIEDKASGTQLIQDLRNDGLSKIKGVIPKGDKVMRMNAQTAQFDGGFVVLPLKAHWQDPYVTELTTFPKAKFDDQVDSTSQALAWIQTDGNEPGILRYYRELAESKGRV